MLSVRFELVWSFVSSIIPDIVLILPNQQRVDFEGKQL